jgi:hypothetical protein
MERNYQGLARPHLVNIEADGPKDKKQKFSCLEGTVQSSWSVGNASENKDWFGFD